MGIIWTIIIGFVAGVIAKLIMPGKNEPSGFILTTILGIVGAFLATYLGHVEVREVYWYLSAVPELMDIVAARFEAFAGHSPDGVS